VWLTDRAARPTRILAAIAVAALMLATGGCDQLSTPDPERMDAISAELGATLAQRPDVVKAEVFYQDSLDAAGTALVAITVKPGADFDPVVDEALRLVWQSRLGRLFIIEIDVTDLDNHTGTQRKVRVDQEKAELERRYGPHPAT